MSVSKGNAIAGCRTICVGDRQVSGRTAVSSFSLLISRPSNPLLVQPLLTAAASRDSFVSNYALLPHLSSVHNPDSFFVLLLSVFPSSCLLFLKLKPQGHNFQVRLLKAISKDYTQCHGRVTKVLYRRSLTSTVAFTSGVVRLLC
jgi:hypothetical protein